MRIRLSNPALLYILVWGTTYALTSRGYLTFMVPIAPQTALLVGVSIGMALLITLPLVLLARLPVETTVDWSDSLRERVLRARSVLLLVAFMGFAVEAVDFGGIPLIFALVGNYTKSYGDFGFPTVHGLLMAMFFVGTLLTALEMLDRPRWRAALLLCGLLGWPMAMLNRGAMMWVLLEVVVLVLLLRRLRPVALLGVAAAGAGVVLLFGLLGDIRLGENARFFEALISDAAPGWFREGPTGLVWVYAYLSGSLNNVNAALQNLDVSYQMYYSTVNLFPSLVRPVVFDEFAPRYALPLVSESFNTSTFFATYLADFGVAGALAAVALLQLTTTLAYIRARAGSIPGMVAFAVLGRALMLTVFWDTATSLVTLFELAIVGWIAWKLFEPAGVRLGSPSTRNPDLLDAN